MTLTTTFAAFGYVHFACSISAIEHAFLFTARTKLDPQQLFDRVFELSLIEFAFLNEAFTGEDVFGKPDVSRLSLRDGEP